MTVQKNDQRILVLAPFGRDAALTCEILRAAGISAYACADMAEFCQEVTNGTGAVLMTEEALIKPDLNCLLDNLERQELWSDLPIILFTVSKESAKSLLESLGTRLNLTLLERPINITIVISVARSALRARQRQFQMRDLLREMERATRTKDEFLAIVSHELRTPLNALLGWAIMLRSHKLDDATTARALEIIERSARVQAQLIDDLLDVSRIISGKLQLDVRPLDVSPIVQAAIDIVRPAIEAKAINLSVELNPKLGVVRADPNRLQQVVWNLLTNAVKFTPKGGEIRVQLSQLNSNIEISVSDTGLGIPTEALPQVFDRFWQADSSTTRKFGGMGLGLAIVRHLVELLGGTVSAYSEGPNTGATFTVRLPLMIAANGEISRPNHLLNGQKILVSDVPLDYLPSLEGVRLLVVEDEPDARNLIITLLQQCKAAVKGVPSTEEAMKALTEWKPDILVSDIEMPEEDGYSLIRKVRTEDGKRGARIPAVALTAHARLEDRMQALSAGYDAHIAKPVELAELVMVLVSLTRRNHNSNDQD
jgi:signal transduction histidine kinase/CheY-like chemotaxis protein